MILVLKKIVEEFYQITMDSLNFLENSSGLFWLSTIHEIVSRRREVHKYFIVKP